jgi:Ribonuclease G/E
VHQNAGFRRFSVVVASTPKAWLREDTTMIEGETNARRLGRASVLRSVQGILRTHTVNPEAVDETIAVLCRAVGGMIAVDFDDLQERDRQVERATKNIREGIEHGLVASGDQP